jgi:plasmid stabilization system protein ParE
MTPIIWSPKALRDLDAIEEYVAQFNPTAARRLVVKIFNRTDRLELWPLAGGLVEEDDDRRYRQVIQGNYRVIYRYDSAAKAVYILTVIHAARLLDPDSIDESA